MESFHLRLTQTKVEIGWSGQVGPKTERVNPKVEMGHRNDRDEQEQFGQKAEKGLVGVTEETG